jgi:hypothetical protein
MTTQESLNRLTANVKEMTAKNHRRMTRLIVLQLILLVFVVGYLSWAHSRIAQVDADVIVAKLQEQVTKNLPELSNQLADRLNAYAPELLNKLQQKVVEIIPSLSKKLQVEIDGSLKEITNKTIAQMANLNEWIKQEKANIDIKEKQLLDKDKIAILMKDVRTKAKDVVVQSANAIKGDYSKRLMDINSQLEHLTMNDNLLKDDEVMQKRVIEIWVKLIKMNTGGDLFK